MKKYSIKFVVIIIIIIYLFIYLFFEWTHSVKVKRKLGMFREKVCPLVGQ